MKKQKVFALIVLITFIVLGAILFVSTDISTIQEHPAALFIYFLIIITEVIITPIPGGIIAFLGAATFGFWKAWPIQYIANLVGGLIVFSLARTLGKSFVDKQIPSEKHDKLNTFLETKKSFVWIFYAIPIFPIDTISLLLGLSDMKKKTYVIILLTALPFYTGIVSLLGAYFGSAIPFINYIATITFFAILVGIIYFVIKK